VDEEVARRRRGLLGLGRGGLAVIARAEAGQRRCGQLGSDCVCLSVFSYEVRFQPSSVTMGKILISDKE
jgi:hypothetical protein